MAFDKLTPNQIKTLILLIKLLLTGNYSDVFFLRGTLGSSQVFVELWDNGGVRDKEIGGLTDSDIQTLLEEGYMTLTTSGSASLTAKAHQQYKLLKGPATGTPAA